MTITLNSYDRQRRAGTYQYVKAYSQSTGTTIQTIDVTADVVVFNAGTATFAGAPGAGSEAINTFAVPNGVEGQEILIFNHVTSTGMPQVRFNTQVSGRQPYNVSMTLVPAATEPDTAQTSATGFYAITGGVNSFLRAVWRNAAWHVIEARGATLSTGT